MSANEHTRSAYDVRAVRFQYASFSRSAEPLLTDLTFSVGEGEILGIVGPNGAGKSTVLKLLAKLLRPQAGEIILFGRDLSRMSQREIAHAVAVVPQETQQPFPYTIAEMVLMGRFARLQGSGGLGWETARDRDIAQRAMEALDVAHLSQRLIGEVSGGERQRVVIARALAQEPRVLLLDEPTAFLDLHHQVDIVRTLRRLNRDHRLTIVLVSHDVNLVSQTCDRLILLQHGTIAHIGTPHEVIRPDIFERVYGCKVVVDTHPHSGLPRVSVSV